MTNALRYIILHHTGWNEPHYDLFLDPGPDMPLWTWRLDQWPEPAHIERIADHRRAYLDYEGPVSGNRGEVKRVAGGEYEIVAEDNRVRHVRFMPGEMELVLPK